LYTVCQINAIDLVTIIIHFNWAIVEKKQNQLGMNIATLKYIIGLIENNACG